MEQQYEYVAVDFPAGSRKTDQATTEAINRIAVHGWRLVHVLGNQYGPTQMVFERPKQ